MNALSLALLLVLSLCSAGLATPAGARSQAHPSPAGPGAPVALAALRGDDDKDDDKDDDEEDEEELRVAGRA